MGECKSMFTVSVYTFLCIIVLQTRWAVYIPWRAIGQHLSVGTIAIVCYAPSLNSAFLAVVAVCAIVAAWHYSIPDAHSQLFEVKLAQQSAAHAAALEEERKKLVGAQAEIEELRHGLGLHFKRTQEAVAAEASLNRTLAALGQGQRGGQAQWQQRIRAIQTAAEAYKAENEELKARLAALTAEAEQQHTQAGTAAGTAAVPARRTPVPQAPAVAMRNPSPGMPSNEQEDGSLPELPELGHGPAAPIQVPTAAPVPARPVAAQQAKAGQGAVRMPNHLAATAAQNRQRLAVPPPVSAPALGVVAPPAPFSFGPMFAAPPAPAQGPVQAGLPVVATQAYAPAAAAAPVPPPPAAAAAFTAEFGAWAAPAPPPAPAQPQPATVPTQNGFFGFAAAAPAPAPSTAATTSFTFDVGIPAAAPAPAPAAPAPFNFTAFPTAPAPVSAPAPSPPVSTAGPTWTFGVAASVLEPRPAQQETSFVFPDAENSPFNLMHAPTPTSNLAPIPESFSSTTTEQQAALPTANGNLFVFTHPNTSVAVPTKPNKFGTHNAASNVSKKPTSLKSLGTGIGAAARVPVRQGQPTSILDAVVPARVSESVPIPGQYVPPQDPPHSTGEGGQAQAGGLSVGMGRTGFVNTMRQQQAAGNGGVVKQTVMEKVAVFEDANAGGSTTAGEQPAAPARVPLEVLGPRPQQNMGLPQVGQPVLKSATAGVYNFGAGVGVGTAAIAESLPQVTRAGASAAGQAGQGGKPVEQVMAIARVADEMIKQAYESIKDWNPRQLMGQIRSGGSGVWEHITLKDQFVELCIIKGQFEQIVQLTKNAEYHPEDTAVKKFVILALCWDAWGNKLSADLIKAWVDDNGLTAHTWRTAQLLVMTKEGKKMVNFKDAIRNMPCMAPVNPSRPTEVEIRLLVALQHPLPPAAHDMPTEQELAALGGEVNLQEEAMDCNPSPIRPAIGAH